MANISLHDLDMELEKRGHKFVRSRMTSWYWSGASEAGSVPVLKIA